MKLVNTETGQWTAIKKDDFGFRDMKGAVNRLVARAYPGHFGWVYVGEEDCIPNREFDIAVYRAVGGMTLKTGEKCWFRVG